MKQARAVRTGNTYQYSGDNMASGFVHLLSFIALVVGILLGILATKTKSENLFMFSLSLLVGWLIHVLWFDHMLLAILSLI